MLQQLNGDCQIHLLEDLPKTDRRGSHARNRGGSLHLHHHLCHFYIGCWEKEGENH